MARTMLYEVGDKLAIAVHSRENPTDEEWDALLESIGKKSDLRSGRFIVFSMGGGPNAQQRRRMVALMKGSHPPTALLTDDIAARGVATAMSWFRKDLAVFPTSKRDEAYRFLGLSAAVIEKVNGTIDRFLRELGES